MMLLSKRRQRTIHHRHPYHNNRSGIVTLFVRISSIMLVVLKQTTTSLLSSPTTTTRTTTRARPITAFSNPLSRNTFSSSTTTTTHFSSSSSATTTAQTAQRRRFGNHNACCYHRRQQQHHHGFSSLAAVSYSDGFAEEEEERLLLPQEFKLEYPKTLSPSSILEFKACPQSFLFQYLYGMKQPVSEVLAKGTICHSSLEQIYDLDPSDRTLENLQNLFRKNWQDLKTNDDKYKRLFVADDNDDENNNNHNNWNTDKEVTWGKSALQLLTNYYNLENPATDVQHPNPYQREMWVNANLPLDPYRGATSKTKQPTTPTMLSSSSLLLAEDGDEQEEETEEDTTTVHVRGIIDRLDLVRNSNIAATTTDESVTYRVVDYKTGKAPHLKYSPRMNQQIIHKAFYQLKIYALLLREKNYQELSNVLHGDDDRSGINVRYLRLFYLTTAEAEAGLQPPRAKYLDMDLGETQELRDSFLNEIHHDISGVYRQMTELIDQQDPKRFVGCDRSFCWCHKCRPRFVPGTLWEP